MLKTPGEGVFSLLEIVYLHYHDHYSRKIGWNISVNLHKKISKNGNFYYRNCAN